MPVNRRIISKYSSNRVISVLTPAARSRAIIDSPYGGDGPRACSFPPVLRKAALLPLYSTTSFPPFPLWFLSPFILPLGETRRIRGISYLAQIQSYEYNFPREQSFIVIVNPSVNCSALSITGVRRYNSVLSPSSLPFQPPPSYRRHRSQTSISRHNTPRCSVRDEDEDEGRRVKGLYELIWAEGMMIEVGWEGVAISETTSSRRNETPLQRRVIRSYDRTRTINRSHSLGIFIISLSADALFPKYKCALSSTYKLGVSRGIYQKNLTVDNQFNKLFLQLPDLNDNIVTQFDSFELYSYNYYLLYNIIICTGIYIEFQWNCWYEY